MIAIKLILSVEAAFNVECLEPFTDVNLGACMNFKSLLSNFAAAFSAQFLAVAVSIVSSLLVPKLLGVAEYGYWQLFIFYTSYTGLCSLGLHDGIYLTNGGIPRSKIDKRTINSQFWFGLLYQSLIAVGFVLFALFGNLGAERSTVIFSVAIYFPIQNAAYILGDTIQAMNETKTWSYSCIVERICYVIPVIILLLVREKSFEPYVYTYVFSSLCQLIYLAWHMKDFLTAGLRPISETVQATAEVLRGGFKLMIAGIVSTLIVGLARFVIDAVWGIETFGQLSLSLSCVNFFLMFSSQVSMVLFPALRQADEHEVTKFYSAARDSLELFSPLLYLLYYPFVWLLGLWLPQYSEAFVYFSYLIPICVFDSQMQIVSQTMFKVRREESLLLYINIGAIALSAVMSLIGGYVLHSLTFILLGLVMTIAVRALFSEHLLNQRMGLSGSGIAIGEIILSIIFILAAAHLPALTTCAIFTAAYAIFAFVFRTELKAELAAIKNVARETSRTRNR